MPKRLELIGKRFGRLTVLGEAGRAKKSGGFRWNCICDCGTETIVYTGSLRSGNTKSCGCLHKETIIKRNITHGMSHTSEYRTWRGMLQRCNDPNCPAFNRYGGVGVKVCNRWQSFENFFADMGKKPTNRYSIERVNGNGNYCPKIVLGQHLWHKVEIVGPEKETIQIA